MTVFMSRDPFELHGVEIHLHEIWLTSLATTTTYMRFSHKEETKNEFTEMN